MSKKRLPRHSRRTRRNHSEPPLHYSDDSLIDRVPQSAPQQDRRIRALTEAQGHYSISIQKNTITFGVGPAGTGKTYVMTNLAVDALLNKDIHKIIVTRPAQEADGEDFGFLPGELAEKYAPYLAPIQDVLNERLSPSYVNNLIKRGYIEAIPLAFMRGRSFENCWMLLDEAQNTTPAQMKMFLTRIGSGSKMIIDGDPNQKDIRGISGLDFAVQRLARHAEVGVVRFDRSDIVRHGIIQDIIEAFED